jgi:hypothetical protein
MPDQTVGDSTPVEQPGLDFIHDAAHCSDKAVAYRQSIGRLSP